MTASTPQPAASAAPARKRGRPVEFEADRVLDAAESILADSGPDGLTMKALAQSSGSTVAALYRHLGDRDGVLSATLDRYAERLDWPDFPGEPEERLRSLCRNVYTVLAAAPWIVTILARGGQTGAAALRFGDQFLGAAEELGADPDQAVRAYRTVWNYTLGALITRTPTVRTLDPESPLARKIKRAAESGNLPRIARLAELPVGTPQAAFEEGLDALIRGLIAGFGR